MKKAVLVLEDGTYYVGKSFGREGETIGEVVFNTCMTGYQEVISDPSYKGQIVTMTYPLMGNYGCNDIDLESDSPKVEGFIVKEVCENPSNFRSKYTMHEYFSHHGIVGITGIDTRALTKHIRQFGSMFGIISTKTGHIDILLKELKNKMKTKQDLVASVSCKKTIFYPGKGKRVVVFDFGCKENIVRHLKKLDCEIYVVPYDTTKEKILDLEPDGIMLSNGPGDPMDLPQVISTIKSLVGYKPMYGICLGHQLLGLALGGKTYKLKFGHHGGNHAIRQSEDKRCFITSQNHNYALEHDFSDDITITEINVNDQTVEGFKHKTLPIRGVQFHPEACPGPYDTEMFFESFVSNL